MQIEFRILGPLEILRAGVVVPSGAGKQQAVLADLLIHAGQVVSVDRLIDDLWGADPPETAANAVQVYVAGLRRALGAGASQLLVTRRPGYKLVVEPDAMDLFRFNSHVRAGRAVMESDPREAATRFAQALALWRGTPLGGVEFEKFAVGEVARLDELRVSVEEDRIESELAIGRHGAVIGDLQGLIGEHPLRERLRGQLMIALYRSGRQAEALAGYRAFRDYMDEELGIEPGVALRELEGAILNQASGLASPDPGLSSTPVSHPAVPRTVVPLIEPAGEPRAGGHIDRERKVVTVVWCGLEFETAESGSDVEDQWERLDHFHHIIRGFVESHGGTLQLVAGGTVMAAFGVPVAHEDDPERAVRASLRIVDAVAAERAAGGADGTMARVRVGMASGEALVTMARGSSGSGSVAGDVVGVASRILESSSMGSVHLAESTHRLVARIFECERIQPLEAQGRARSLPMWRVNARRLRNRAGATDPFTSPLVGRDDERDLLTSYLARSVRADVVQLVTIVGEPGVGKSRLIADLFQLVGGSEHPVSWRQGRCLPYGDGIGRWALAEIVKAHAGILETDAPDVASKKLDDVVPEGHPEAAWLRQRLRPLLGIEAPGGSREDNFEAWRRFLELVADPGPAIVVFEDLHWADEEMLAFVEHVVEFAGRAPLLLIATARPELYDHVPRWAASLRNTSRMDLSPLSDQEMRQLIAHLLGSRVFPAPLQRAVLSRAGGNPLFAGEFVRLLQERELLVRRNSTWILDTVAEAPIPDTVHDTIAARVDALSPERKRALQDAAVIGEIFWSSALTFVGECQRADVDRALQDLCRLGLIRRVARSSMQDQEEFAFHHALVRDVCFAQIPRAQRVGRHVRTAEWLEGVGSADGLIGQHLAEAFRYRAELRQVDSYALALARRSVHFLVSDCRRALRCVDRSTAERQIGRVVSVLTTCGQGAPLNDLPLMERTGKLLIAMGRWYDAVTLLAPYAECGSGPLMRDLGVALCQIHRSEPRSAEFRRGQRLLEAAGTPPNMDLDALASLAGTWKGVDDVRAHQVYRECLDLDPDNPYALGNVLEYEILATRDWSIVDDLRAQLEAALRRCRSQAEMGENLPWAHYDGGEFSLLLGRPFDALGSYAKAVQLTTADHMLATSMASLANLAATRGEVESLDWMRSLLAIARCVHFPSPVSRAGLTNATPLEGVDRRSRVVMFAGGTDASVETWLEGNAEMVLEAFADFEGVVVSGGTRQGVPGLGGSLRSRYPERIRALGYLPAVVPKSASLETRGDELRRTMGSGFTIAENLQAWADLIVSGLGPEHVKMLALNGGRIAEAEYRIALALGCAIGVVVGSGRAADRLLQDPDWRHASNLTSLDPDSQAIRSFLEFRP